MKQTTLNKAKEALALMSKGVLFTDAAKKAKIDTRTLKKAIKLLKLRKTKRRGRYYILTDYNKKIIDSVISLMSTGWSASTACRASHTTLKSMSRVNISIGGVPVPLIKKVGRFWELNVYLIHHYSCVFYGRLMGTKMLLTSGRNPATPSRTPDLQDDDYADIMWQCDFDPFRTTLTENEVIEYYSKKVLGVIEHEIDPHSVFNRASGFGEEVECGIDDRPTKDEYIAKEDLPKRVTDTGLFEIIVRRKSSVVHYPSVPAEIKFSKNVQTELKLSKRSPAKFS